MKVKNTPHKKLKVKKQTPERNHFHVSQQIKKIHHLIAENNYPSVKKLQDETGLSRRSVFRYLEYLRELGAPIEHNSVKKGYYFTDIHWQIPPLMLSEGDLLAFFIAEQALASDRKLAASTATQNIPLKISRVSTGTGFRQLSDTWHKCFFSVTAVCFRRA
jgi:predicted DNA-binding transcriptional regulator YafY